MLKPAFGLEADFIFSEDKDNKAVVIKLSGKIEPGDYKMVLRLLTPGTPITLWAHVYGFELDSPGGDVREAMLIADALRDIYPHIRVKGTCASSCVLLYLAGAARSVKPGSRVGIHRPFFPKEYFTSLKASAAEQRYSEMEKSFREYVLHQGLPPSLYEKLLATPSTEVYWLNRDELLLVGEFPPFYQELMEARCNTKNALAKPGDTDGFWKCYAKMKAELIVSSHEKLLTRLRDEGMATKACFTEGKGFSPCPMK